MRIGYIVLHCSAAAFLAFVTAAQATDAEDFARVSCAAAEPLLAKLFSGLYEAGAEDLLKPTTAPNNVAEALIILQLAFRTDPKLQPISRADFLKVSERLCEATYQSYFELRQQAGR